jgi:hypothetical protein
MDEKFLFAIGSCRSGQAHSTGWSWGEYGGSLKGTMFPGMFRLFRE